jgi:hypothetical protein
LIQDPIITIRPTGVIIPPFEEFFMGKTLALILAVILMLTGVSFFILWMKKLRKTK